MTKRERIYLRVDKGCLVPADIEHWRTPIGFPDWVRVSRSGDVFLMEHSVTRGSSFMVLSAKQLKKKSCAAGYQLVQFRIGGKNAGYRVHRLVMLAHSGTAPDGMDVNHKNGDKADNRIENLEWCTRSENLTHSYRELGRIAAWKGKPAHNKGKLNPKYGKKIIGTPVNGGPDVSFLSASDAGRSGFSRDGIAHCLIGKQKTANGYRWRFSK